jgi:predicted transcriptional regulator
MALTKEELEIKEHINSLTEQIENLEYEIKQIQNKCEHKFEDEDWGSNSCFVCGKWKWE